MAAVFAAVIPTYNHAATLPKVIAQFHARFSDFALIIVDDGSKKPLVWTGFEGGLNRIEGDLNAIEPRLIRFEANRGKGRALLAGFAAAREMGATHAITLDADGQHDVADIENLLTESRGYPDDLIIGNRKMGEGENIPSRSLLGRRLAHFWLQIQTGQEIPDSQCGLRIYPLTHVLALKYWFGRFDFETEVLARLAWAGLTIRSVPVRCIYFSATERVSHYRPVWDTVRGVRVNIFLVARRLMPVPFHKCVHREKTKTVVQAGAWWRWRAWRETWRKMVSTGTSNAQLSAAIAVGVFIGLAPIPMVQTVVTIYVAERLHLNIVAAVAASQISNPLFAPVWWFLYLETGYFALHGEFIGRSSLPWPPTWHAARAILGSLIVGSFIVAVVVATISLFMARMALRWKRGERDGELEG